MNKETRNPSPFRPMNEAEINALENWRCRGKIPVDSPVFSELGGFVCELLRVSYNRTQGGFTVCALSFRYDHPTRGASHEIRTGSSRRSFKDPYNPIKGEMLALFRAVNSHPVTLP